MATAPQSQRPSHLGPGNPVRYTSFLARLSNLSHQQFSEKWARHAELAAPWFIFHDIHAYTQTHLSPSAQASLEGDTFLAYDGMVDLQFSPATCTLFDEELVKSKRGWQGAEQYFHQVIMPDEKQFWDRTGENNVRVDKKAATGVLGWERKIIDGGKIVIEIPAWIMERWQGYLRGDYGEFIRKGEEHY